LSNILIIGDTHDKPGVDKDRFRWAANLALERQPDTIVHLGDWSTFDSVSDYEGGSIHAEGRRYVDDINSHIESLDAFHKPIDEYNRKHSLWKKKKYKPRLIYCVGNHDMRIEKFVINNPKMKGVMSLDDMQMSRYGWETYPITRPADAHGIAFGHFFTSGIMGKAIGGLHHGSSLIMKGIRSCVVGHSHLRDFHERTDVFGSQVFGLVAGCYYSHGDHYTTEGKRMWRGLVYLTVNKGEANPEFIGIDDVEEMYG